MKYENFYETLAEAHIRLLQTVIWYNGPGEEGAYYVLAITDHVGDGKFRIYMRRIGQKYNFDPNVYYPCDVGTYGKENPALGVAMDDFMKNYPKAGIVRKEMNSPHFNRFRPFPLGMMNKVDRDKEGKAFDSGCYYLERQPNRLTQQGLIKTMVYATEVNAALNRGPSQVHYTFDLHNPDFDDCIMGKYPDPDECIRKLRDPKIANEAIAFDRYFAFVRGPIDMMFLSYKGEIVGIMPTQDLRAVRVGREHRYTREAISDLHIFKTVEG